MKNNALFLLVMIALLITGLGALYYQYSIGEFNFGVDDMTKQTNVTTTQEPTADNEASPAAQETPTATSDAQLEAIPSVGTTDDLETLQQELEATEIFDEDFGDL